MRFLISLAVSVMALFSLRPAPEFHIWNLLYLLGCGVFYFAAVWFALPRLDNRKAKYCIPLGLFFGLCTAIGAEYFTTDQLDLSVTGLAAKFYTVVSMGLVYTALAVLMFSVAAKDSQKQITGKRMFCIALGVILICWLPCYIAYYPGIFAYDIPTQLYGISHGTLTTDHPLLHTLIAWACFSLGKVLGSYTLGGGIYSLVQMLLLAASFAAVVAYLKPPILRWCSLCWFALLPIHPLFAVNATKDVLFAACTIVFLLLLAELIRNPNRLNTPWFWLAFSVAVVAMSLMRNTGIYVFFVFIPFLVITFRGRRWKTLGLCLLCLVLFFGSRSILNTTLHVQEGRVTEVLSVPLQQIARCAKAGILTEDELKEVERYLPEETWKKYQSRLADEVKNNADRAAIKEDPIGLIRLWFRLGFKHPKQYIEAFMGMNVGYWYPDAEYPDPMIWHSYIETHIKDIRGIKVEDRNLWPAMRSFYNNVALGKAEALPPLALLMKPGLYCWITLCLLALALYRRNRTAGLILCFLTLSWLLQLLSPIALLRYAYPFMTAVPLSLGALFNTDHKKIPQ